MTATLSTPRSIASWLGDDAESLLTYQAKYPKEKLHLPGADLEIYFEIDLIFSQVGQPRGWCKIERFFHS